MEIVDPGTLATVALSAATAGGSYLLSRKMAEKATPELPKIKPPPRMPDLEDPRVLEAARIRERERMARRGRESTMLTDSTGLEGVGTAAPTYSNTVLGG